MKADNTEQNQHLIAKRWFDELQHEEQLQLLHKYKKPIYSKACMYYTSYADALYIYQSETQPSTPESVEEAAALWFQELAPDVKDYVVKRNFGFDYYKDAYGSITDRGHILKVSELIKMYLNEVQSPSTCKESLQVQKESQGDVAELVKAVAVQFSRFIRNGNDHFNNGHSTEMVFDEFIKTAHARELIQRFTPKQ